MRIIFAAKVMGSRIVRTKDDGAGKLVAVTLAARPIGKLRGKLKDFTLPPIDMEVARVEFPFQRSLTLTLVEDQQEMFDEAGDGEEEPRRAADPNQGVIPLSAAPGTSGPAPRRGGRKGRSTVH